MILQLFRKHPPSTDVYAAYRAIVTQSRQPVFYAEWGVPDTVTGRFDMISLHLALLFRRLRAEGPAAREFSQAVFDLFFRDMDRSLREMGAGDLGIAKRVRSMGNLFFGLLSAIDLALDVPADEQLVDVLDRNVFSGSEQPQTAALAAYLRRCARDLAALPAADLVRGAVFVPEAA